MRLFEVECLYDFNGYLSFIKFHYAINFRRKIFNGFLSLMIFLMAIFCTMERDYILAIFFYLFLFVLLVITYSDYLPVRIAKRMKLMDPCMDKLVNYFVFFDDRLELKNEMYSVVNNYKDLYLVYDTDDYYYIYLNNRSAYIVPKACVNNDKSLELSCFLKKCLGRKYVQRLGKAL